MSNSSVLSLNTTTPSALYNFPLDNTGDFIRKAQSLYGQEYFQYAETLPFFEAIVLEAFIREHFSVTLVDGTVIRFSMDRRDPYREPDYEGFANFLGETDLMDLYDPYDVAQIVGETQSGWKITLKHESIHGWSVWLSRKYATYEIFSVYQLPWRDAEYAPSGEVRALVAATEAAYQEIAPAAHKAQQVQELAQALFNAIKVLLPLNEIVEYWPSVVNFNQPSITIDVPDHYQLRHKFAPFGVTALGDCAVEIGNDGWSWTEFYRDFSPTSFEKIAKEIIEKDLELALDAEQKKGGNGCIITDHGRPSSTPRSQRKDVNDDETGEYTGTTYRTVWTPAPRKIS